MRIIWITKPESALWKYSLWLTSEPALLTPDSTWVLYSKNTQNIFFPFSLNSCVDPPPALFFCSLTAIPPLEELHFKSPVSFRFPFRGAALSHAWRLQTVGRHSRNLESCSQEACVFRGGYSCPVDGDSRCLIAMVLCYPFPL